MEEKRKALYDALAGEYNLGTYEEFTDKINNEDKRRALYDAVKDDYNLGTYEEYSGKLGFPQAAQQADNPFPTFDDKPNDPIAPQEPRRGFVAGVQEGGKGLAAGTAYAAGEAVNAITGSSRDDAKALYELNRMVREGRNPEQETADAWSDFGRELRTGALELLPWWMGKKFKEGIRDKANQQKILNEIGDVLEEAGGDVAKARRILTERANDPTMGDRWQGWAEEKFADINPTEGVGAWIGQNAVQMVPSASALIVGALTKSPQAAQVIGRIGMGTMVGATAGSSMYEAREAGADDLKVRKTGVVDGMIEAITEDIPFNRYTKKYLGAAKQTASKQFMDAIGTEGSLGRNQMEKLLLEANERLGGKLFSKKNLKEYMADIAAEGMSEFSAEALQTMTTMIYEKPEDFSIIGEALNNGLQGFMAGVFMGSVLGGASKTMEHYNNRDRRKEQGFVEVGLVDFGEENGGAMPVEVLTEDREAGIASVLKDGEVVEVSTDAIKPEYRYKFSFNEFENARLEQLEDDAIDNETVTEGQAKAAGDRVAVTAAEVERVFAEKGYDESSIRSLFLGAKDGEYIVFESEEQTQAYNDYVDALTREKEVKSTLYVQQQKEKAAIRENIEKQVGGRFWQEGTESYDENVGATIATPAMVETGTLQDGTIVYITSPANESGERAGITENGEKKIIKNDMLSEGTQIMPLDEYIDARYQEGRNAAEQTRMAEETEQRINDVRSTVQQGTRINVGTVESPAWGVVNAPPTNDGAVVLMEDGGARLLSWDDIANIQKRNPVLTDAELASRESAEILGAEAALKEERAQIPQQAEEASEETAVALEEAKIAEPLPMNEDGTVNEESLWNNDPSRWAEWNDEQRQDNGANSAIAVNAAIANLSGQIAEQQNAYAAMPVGSERNAVEADITEKQKRLEQLVSLQQRYAVQEEMVQNVTETQPEAAAPMTEEEEMQAEEQRREPLRKRAQELSEKLGVKVNIAEDLADVKESVAREQILRVDLTGSSQRVTGWYNPDTNEVTIYLPHVAGADEINATYIHEVVSHRGLKELLGEEGFNVLCDSVWDMMNERQRARFIAYPGVNGDHRKAADEFIAHLSETLNLEESRSLWDRIVAAVEKILLSMGVKLKMSHADLSNLLAASYRRLAGNAGTVMTEDQEAVRTTKEAVESEEQPEAAVSEVETSASALESRGLGVDTQNDDVRYSIRYTPTDAQREAIIDGIVAVTGRDRATAERWLASETSLAAMVGDNMQYLDYQVDSKYKAIKDNSDYPQGTVDFNNICRKRLPFTKMFTRLQRRYPNRVFTADELADIRNIMSGDGLTVACGLCYVEDRRQMVGEVADQFITELQNGFSNYASGNATKRRNADKFLALVGEDDYIPSIYELTTQEGGDKLYNEHRGVWEAFQAFNNARGQQSQNLLQGYAEYKREILSWSDKKVKSVNDNGGLRIFSYSDFEAHHLLDIIQIIIDCASKGVKIQGYTKVPAFARAVANTGIKLNRSLIPLGDTGIKDGQLAFDPVEGIDINDPDFLESNDNVGNILIGINDVQIRMAMVDPRIHYIIPYHARQKENIRKKLNVGEWVNYISTQNERNLSDGKRVKDNINIYTDVLGEDVTNDRQFVEKYLQLCREMGRIPKFDQFLNRDAEGNYAYTPGYYKFLVDFKLFDENGNILPQKPVVAEFDDAFNMQILEDYVKGEQEATGDQMNETYDKIVETLGLDESSAEEEDIRFSVKEENPYDLIEAAKEAVARQGDVRFRAMSDDDYAMAQRIISNLAGDTYFRRLEGEYELGKLASNYAELADIIMAIDANRDYTPVGTALLGFFAENPDMHFPLLFNDSKLGKETSKAFAEELSKVNDPFALYFMKEAWKIHKGSLEQAGLGVKPSSTTKYNKAIDARAEEIKAAEVKGTAFNFKKQESSLDEIDAIFKQLNKDENLALLHDRVMNVARTLGVKVSFAGKRGNTAGESLGDKVSYDYKYFNTPAVADQKKCQTIVHELIHSITTYAIYLEAKAPSMLTDGMLEAVGILRDVYNQIARDPAFKGEYGVTDVYEMVAELSNAQFRDKLKEKNLFQRILDALKRLLGIDTVKEDSAYQVLSDTLDYIIDNYDQAAFDAYALYASKSRSYGRMMKIEEAPRFRITPEQDKAYMDAVEAGDMETAQRMVVEAARLAMPNTKVVDENGNPKVVYHGSTAMFTVFDKSRIGSATGTADGRGFYFTTDRDYALGYKTPNGQLFEVFLNIEKPLSYDKKTITKAQLRKILKEADRVEYEQEGEHYMLSNYANYNDVGIDGAVNEGANLEYDYADNDVELIGSLIGGSGSFDLIMDAVKKVTGKSGMIAPKDNGTIHYVVTDPTGIKSADPVTYDNNGNVIPLSERFNEENEDIRFRVSNDNQAIFVSNAAKAVEAIKQEKATPEQWLKMIEKNGGLKAGEDKWMGLSDWLKSSDKKTLTKQEVLDFINENMIVIEEQHYSNQLAYENNSRLMDEKYPGWQDAFSFEWDDYRDAPNADILDEEEAATLYNKYNEDKVEIDEDGEIVSELDRNKVVLWGEDIAKIFFGQEGEAVRPIHDTREVYTTKGLVNKHEIALTVPTIESWGKSDMIHFGDAGDGRAVAWIRFGETSYKTVSEDSAVYNESIDALYAYWDYLREKYGNGWTNAMTDAEKAEEKRIQEKYKVKRADLRKKVLVIDEIQSKRHQEGREKGYRVSDIEKWLSDNNVEVVESGEFYEFIKNGETDKRFAKVLMNYDVEKAKRLYEYSYNKNKSDIPDAPFDKNWHELAMKRMLRYAAENGYDVIAWTTGDQQADRYNIGGIVDAIDVADVAKGRFVYLSTEGGHIIKFIVNSEGEVIDGNSDYKGRQLSDIVGKELSLKILNAENGATLSGNDLRIGGEGMKGFYDKMLPAFMNKYGKKWGVKVEDIDLPKLGKEGLTMHSVPVTEEMKASVMEGQVMFRVRGEDESATDFHKSVLDHYMTEHKVIVPTTAVDVNDRKAVAEALGYAEEEFSDEMYQQIVDGVNDGGEALYDEDKKRIAIFAVEDALRSADVEENIFHENVHALIAKHPEILDLGQWMWDNANGGVLKKCKDEILSQNYAESKQSNEMLSRFAGVILAAGRAGDVVRILPEDQKKHWELLLNELGYEPERNDGDRKLRFKSDTRRAGVLRDKAQQEVSDNGASERAGLSAEERRIVNELFPGTFESPIERARQDVNENPTEAPDESGLRYRIVTDQETLDRLNSEPTIKVYRAMQLIDGKLYPPMSAKVDGQLREPIELGQWEEAEERPDLADNKGYFKLDKGNKKSLKARYNPYFHTSYTPLNDQFSEAQDRPNLVTVEVEIPASELTSEYKADKAKDSVGEKEWKAGVIQGKLSGTRKVILSRWDKPVRIVPDSEVADVIAKMFEGKDITMPSNVVTPSLRAELESRGVPFVETDNQGKRLRFTRENYDEIPQLWFDSAEQGQKAVELNSVNEIADRYFKDYAGSVILPSPSKALAEKILSGEKKVLIKKGIFAKNEAFHDFTPAQSRKILNDALYAPNRYGQTQPISRPLNWVAIKTGDKNAIIVLEVNETKDYLEIVSWHTLDARNLKRIERQAKREGGEILILDSEESLAASLSALPSDLSSGNKDTDNLENINDSEENVSYRIIGTPTDKVVADGLELTTAQTAELAGNIFSALPEDTRRQITEDLPNILDLKDAIMQIPARLAMKEEWNDEDKAVAEIIARELEKVMDTEMTRPLSISEALWMLYDSMNRETDLISQAQKSIVQRNLGFDSQTQKAIDDAKDEVRFRAVGNASDNAKASLYNKGAVNVWTRLNESFVDMNASVEKLVEAIEKTSGKVAEGFENVLLALNQQSSKGLDAMERYERKFLNPMLDEIRRIMAATDFKYEDIVRHVILKHGLERNEKMAQRDAKAHYQAIYDEIISKIRSMDDRQKRTYLTNAQLKDADAKAALATLQAVDTRPMDTDQLKEHKRKLAKAHAAVKEAAEYLERAKKITSMSEQEALDELDKIFKSIENGTNSVYQELRKNDYSGLTSMFYDQLDVNRKDYETEEEYQSALMLAKNDKYSTLADVEAAAESEVTAFEGLVNTAELWKRINAATKETLKQQYNSNMISKDQYESLRDMFEFYVPLRGFKDNTAEDMYTYYRKPNSTGYTKPILGAEGRKTEAESPFGWIAAMAGSAIASNVKNEAKLALYYFVSNRPDNGIATISKTWFVDSGEVDADGKKIFKPAYPPFSEDLSSDAAKDAFEKWQENMRELQKKGLAYESGQRLNLGNAVVNISDTNKPEHIVNVKVGGKDYTILINGNPRAAQAINGDLNIESSSQDYGKVFGPMLRWMSSVNTSYNPEFWITNMQRDMLFTAMAVSAKGDAAYRRRFASNYMKAFKVISLVAKNEKGSLGNSYIENMYRDFVENGGVTGYTQIKDNETWEKEISRYMKSQNAEDKKMGNAMKMVKDGLHAFHRFGESLEQVSRFAAFLTSREMGKPMSEAVNDAKEITVNFNRKGSGKMISFEEAKHLTDGNGQPLNKFQQWLAVGVSSIAPLGRRFIMFFNAAIQGLNAMYKLYRNNPGKMAGWSIGYFALGVLNALMHSLMDDDDDYLDMPQYERRNSLLLGGNGVYFKWAMPQEARAFYAFGDLAVESVMGRNPHQNILGESLKIGTEILPVNPAEGWKAFLPSVAVPFVELALNEDYKGDPIFSDQKWLSEEEKKRTAKWSKAYQGTGKMYINIAKALNNVTGGDEYDAGLINIQPEKMEHLVQSAFGGTIRTVDKFVNSLMAAIDPEEDVTVRQFPFLNRILTLNDERFKNVHVNDVYDYYAAEADHVASLQKQYLKAGMADEYRQLMDSDEYKWSIIYSRYKKPVKLLQEQIRAAESTAERKELMKRQDELKRKMIKEISDL